MKTDIKLILKLTFLLSILTHTNGFTIGSSVGETVKCSKYDFEERVLEKLVRVEHSMEINRNKMELWEDKIDTTLKNINGEMATKMTEFAEQNRQHLKLMDNEVIKRDNLFKELLGNMSLKLKNEEQDFANIVDNFTNNSDALFSKLMERYTNLSTDIKDNTEVNNELFSDLVKDMNDQRQTLIEVTRVETGKQQKNVASTLENMRAEFNLLSKDITSKMTEFAEKNKQNWKRMENEEIKRENIFQQMLGNMSLKLKNEEQDFVNIIDNFTKNSDALFSNLMERYSTDIKDSTKVNNELFSDFVKKRNATLQTLIEDTRVKTGQQQKSVANTLQNLKAEFNFLAKEMSINQTRMSKTVTTNLLDLIKDSVEEKDCTVIKIVKSTYTSGVYEINPEENTKTKVYCDMTTDGGGWTVIQRHSGTSVDFQRTWVEYEKGFGDPNGDYWLGNKLMHVMTSKYKYELRIDLTNFRNNLKYAVYKTFRIGDSSSKYKLTIGGYSGNAGDKMAYSNGMKFTTKDQDNDQWGLNCAVRNNDGPWWLKHCSQSALNRKYNSKPYWIGISVVKSVMMIRRL